MANYTKDTNEVEAFQFYVHAVPSWFTAMIDSKTSVVKKRHTPTAEESEMYVEIDTAYGTVTANAGDYIIKEMNGKITACRALEFLKNYNKI